MRRVLWHVKGIRPEVRDVAKDAARRSGLSVGAWLNSLIVDAVVNAAGHGAQKLAAATADYPAVRVPRLVLAKGNYFAFAGRPAVAIDLVAERFYVVQQRGNHILFPERAVKFHGSKGFDMIGSG